MIVAFVACLVLGIMGVNIFVDPFGYFHFQGGDYDRIDFGMTTEQYLRYFKAEHIKNYADSYDAYIIGGSKTGAYRPEKLQELDGYRYYNCWINSGNFNDYLNYTKFIIDHTNAKKIILQLSGGEVRFFDRQSDGDMNVIPAEVMGTSQTLETFDYLFKDVRVGLGQLKDESIDKLNHVEKTSYPNPITGEKNLDKYYTAYEKDPNGFIQKYVLMNFDQQMKTLFTTDTKQPAYEQNLAALQEIKDLCDQNGIALQVILAPSFIGEMSEQDSSYYLDYLEKIVMITDVWDFSGYNDIDLNPYNFYNDGHFFYEVADLIVDTMAGKQQVADFGVYVTKENMMEHFQQRKADYERLQKEYQQTGTIALKGYNDSSKIAVSEE